MSRPGLGASAGERSRDLGADAGQDLDNAGSCLLFEAVSVGRYLQRPCRQAGGPYLRQDAAVKVGGCSVGWQNGYGTTRLGIRGTSSSARTGASSAREHGLAPTAAKLVHFRRRTLVSELGLLTRAADRSRGPVSRQGDG